MKLRKLLCASVLCCLPAAANMINNGSFNNSSFLSGIPNTGVALAPGSTALNGWTVVAGAPNSNNNIAYLNNSNIFGVASPVSYYFLDLTGYTDSAPYAGITQWITTIPGMTYTLTYALLVDQSFTNGEDGATASGPVGIAATVGSTTSYCDNFNPPGAGNQDEICSMNFIATSASTQVTLMGYQGKNSIGLANVDIEADSPAVPEPTMALPLVLALGFLLRRASRVL